MGGQSDTRWGNGTRAGHEVARSRILEAAATCYARHGITQTSMAAIAAEAKITRITVYRYFPSGSLMRRAVMRREINDLLEAMAAEMAGLSDFAEWAAECLVFSLLVAPTRLRHRLLYLAEGALETLNDPDCLFDITARFNSEYRHRHGREHPGMFHIADWWARLLISYWTMPCNRPPAEWQVFARALFNPAMIHDSLNRAPDSICSRCGS